MCEEDMGKVMRIFRTASAMSFASTADPLFQPFAKTPCPVPHAFCPKPNWPLFPVPHLKLIQGQLQVLHCSPQRPAQALCPTCSATTT